jgi:hypothetical protein
LAGLKLDAAKVKEIRKEVQERMLVGTSEQQQAKTKVLEVLDKVEAHIESKEPEKAGERFTDISKVFNGLRTALGLDSRFDRKTGLETNNNILLLDKLFEGKLSREDVLKEIFKADPKSLNVGQRIAFLLAVNERFFQLYKDGKPRDLNIEAKKWVGLRDAAEKEGTLTKTETEKKQKAQDEIADGKIFASRQGVLLIQFMLGRIGGLEAGAGKSPVFLLGFGDYILKSANAGPEAKRVGELVVFAPAEVDKYTGQGEYSKLAHALGITLKDGRNLAGENAETLGRAKDAFTAKEGEFNLVVSDLHSRGFLERQLRNDPKSALAKLVKNNVGVLGLDEVDALLLSTMPFCILQM